MGRAAALRCQCSVGNWLRNSSDARARDALTGPTRIGIRLGWPCTSALLADRTDAALDTAVTCCASCVQTLNVAAKEGLPLLFIVIDNGRAINTFTGDVAKNQDVYLQGQHYGIPGLKVDGQDMVSVMQGGRAVVDHVRKQGPAILQVRANPLVALCSIQPYLVVRESLRPSSVSGRVVNPSSVVEPSQASGVERVCAESLALSKGGAVSRCTRSASMGTRRPTRSTSAAGRRRRSGLARPSTLSKSSRTT